MQQQYPHILFKIINSHNTLQFLLPGKHVLTEDHYSYVSFFAYGQPLRNVTLRGVKYKTTDEVIEQGTTRFTSNEIIGEGSISFTDGICLMIKSKD